jgi:hypothetical protein
MRRAVAAVIAVVAAVCVGTVRGEAATSDPSNRYVNGHFVGTTFFELLSGRCDFIHLTLDGDCTTAKGRMGSFHLDVGPMFGVDSGTVESGSFTLRDPRGATLVGSVRGVYATTAPPRIPFALTLDVETGTGQFRHTRGAIALTGVWEFVANPSPISGTLVGSLSR